MSIIVIPTMIFMPISGPVAEIIGRKPTLIIGQIFILLGWTILYFAKQFYMLLIGRFLIGVGTGICLPLTIIFNSEIALVKMRGILSMISSLTIHIGAICSLLIATTFSLEVLIILSSIPSIIFLGFSIFLPESPVWLMRKGRTESAKKALLTLRGSRYDMNLEIQELQELVDSQDDSNFFEKVKELKSRNNAIPLIIMAIFMMLQVKRMK